MDSATKQRYLGYAATPPLWKGTAVSPYAQIELPAPIPPPPRSAIFTNRRLGKLVEEFVFHDLQRQSHVHWLADNLQIQDNQRTVGELDALYYAGTQAVHLEVAYKFYLYDTLEQHADRLARWIGPNRKDRLSFKLDKLHRRQFPLLHHQLTRTYLDRLQLDATSIDQRLCFKAQLYLPFQSEAVGVSPLNEACVAGYYLTYAQLAQLNSTSGSSPKSWIGWSRRTTRSTGSLLRWRRHVSKSSWRNIGRRWCG